LFDRPKPTVGCSANRRSINPPLFNTQISIICHQCYIILPPESMLSKTLIQPTHFPTWVSATLKMSLTNSITHLPDYNKMESHSPKNLPVSQPCKGSVSKKFPKQNFIYINAPPPILITRSAQHSIHRAHYPNSRQPAASHTIIISYILKCTLLYHLQVKIFS
jgi:hypothetical protein